MFSLRMNLAIVLAAWMAAGSAAAQSDWPHYGGDKGGTRYVPHKQITPENVSKLKRAWVYRTGELERRSKEMNVNSSNQNTPVIAAGNLIVCTPFNRIIALDPATGKENWVFDPQVSITQPLPNQYVCRGVTQWIDAQADEGAQCRHRLFFATNDLRLFAIDAADGKPCASFGEGGHIALVQDRAPRHEGEIKLGSPPAIVNDVVVVGSAILDNVRVDAPFGTVRAFSTRTGEPVWSFDPIPREEKVGGANVWTAMAADNERDLIFLPTSSASPDFYGGLRPGDNKWANSIVALKGSTGEMVWGQQLVRHDIWDYDLPSQPMLVEVERDGAKIPAVVQTTKQGFVFTFNRETGEPLFPIEEMPIPGVAAKGDTLAKSQPRPTAPPPLVPQELKAEDAHGFTPFDRGYCKDRIARLKSQGLFTPPSEQGTIFYPSTAGGANWGGSAFDPVRRLMFVNTSRVAQVITLLPRGDEDKSATVELSAEADVSPQDGAPYRVKREWLLSTLGAPCSPPPWGGLSAVDLEKGTIVWDSPLGSIRDNLLIPLPMNTNLGTPNIGGPVATGGGLIFIAAAQDNYLRAYRSDTGEEIWKDRLPAGGQTTPMSYSVNGRQFIVITSGQHLWFQTPPGDYVVAYALPTKG